MIAGRLSSGNSIHHSWNQLLSTELRVSAHHFSSKSSGSKDDTPSSDKKDNSNLKSRKEDPGDAGQKPSIFSLKTVLAGMKVDRLRESSGTDKSSAPQTGHGQFPNKLSGSKNYAGLQSELKPLVEPQLLQAVQKIADAISSKVDPVKTKSELLEQLTDRATKTENSKKAVSGGLSQIITSMKIDRSKPKPEVGSHSVFQDTGFNLVQEPVRAMLDPQMYEAEMASTDRPQVGHRRGPLSVHEKIDLFGANPLNIFLNMQPQSQSVGSTLKTWKLLEERELERMQVRPPKNAFDEMIRWTKEGKLWTFPIDNEQGWDREHQVDFTEHIFLDYLIADFPQKGPIKQFMDIIVIALSRNPWISVEEKAEHVDWFRKYFKEKQDILIDTLGPELTTFGDNIPGAPIVETPLCKPDIHQIHPCKHF